MKKAYKIRLAIAGIVGIIAILAICGAVYPIKLMDIQFTPLLQRTIFDFSIAALVLFAALFIITLLFGRFYCSTICPFGILQEFTALVLRHKKKNSQHGNYGFKYLIVGLVFGALFGGSALLIRYIDPYTMFGSAFSLTILGLVFTSCVLALVFYKNRFFCTNICPVGAVLGLISKVSINKIYIDKDKCVACGMCANNCPSGCITKAPDTERMKGKYEADNEICVKCLKCLSVCPRGAVKYGIQPVKFSIKRREVLWGAGALALLGAGYVAGLKFTETLAKNIRNIILPAGAGSPERMANKCLNCNLCITKCPKGILVKANKDFPAVHIDYTKGKHYCKFDCNNCSEACPSGAIRKISLEEKRSTRIGMASIDDKCVKCGTCFNVCPTDAISWEAGQKALVDGTKCIGCGKCAANCRADAITIFGVNKQQLA